MNSGEKTYGVTSMVAPLKRVAMRRPGNAMLNADSRRWHYGKEIVAEKLLAQYQSFVDLVEQSGAEIMWMPDHDDDLADSVFTYDPSFVTAEGAIIMRAGKKLREKEASLHKEFYNASGIPVVGEISGNGQIEGGDCFWLDDKTLAVGLGFRTNREGAKQLADLLQSQDVSVETFDLPVYQGKDACLHLMSVVSPLAEKLALVYSPLMPVALYQTMLDMGYELLDAPVTEFTASGGLNLNVLTTSPMQCIAVAGFPETLALMRDARCEVKFFIADEICIPCEGGPTCMTRPVLRSQ